MNWGLVVVLLIGFVALFFNHKFYKEEKKRIQEHHDREMERINREHEERMKEIEKSKEEFLKLIKEK